MTIKNIIFDLGGVIINIDYRRTSDAFSKLGAFDFDKVYSQSKQDHFFDDYETGKITSDDFRNILNNKLGITATHEEFDHAWNAMLLDLPKNRLELLLNLKNNYRIFLFSNTNEIHLKQVFNICSKQHGFNSFNGYFEKEYYSHIFGQRKPNADAFLSILTERNMEAEETLFVDDSFQHILGARDAGLHTLHLTPEKPIIDTLSYISKINSQGNTNVQNRQKVACQ